MSFGHRQLQRGSWLTVVIFLLATVQMPTTRLDFGDTTDRMDVAAVLRMLLLMGRRVRFCGTATPGHQVPLSPLHHL